LQGESYCEIPSGARENDECGMMNDRNITSDMRRIVLAAGSQQNAQDSSKNRKDRLPLSPLQLILRTVRARPDECQRPGVEPDTYSVRPSAIAGAYGEEL
jgi:hypothetical protein